MALNQHVEWDLEEVAEGYDLSSIYEGVGENSTVPVTSSVANNTDQAGPSTNFTVGLSHLLEKVAEMVVNTTTTTTAPITVAPPSSSLPTSIPHLVKKAVEHLGREPSSPVATVCIILVF